MSFNGIRDRKLSMKKILITTFSSILAFSLNASEIRASMSRPSAENLMKKRCIDLPNDYYSKIKAKLDALKKLYEDGLKEYDDYTKKSKKTDAAAAVEMTVAACDKDVREIKSLIDKVVAEDPKKAKRKSW